MNAPRGNVGSFRCKFVCSSLLTWGPLVSMASQQWDINQNIFSRALSGAQQESRLATDWINFEVCYQDLSNPCACLWAPEFMDSEISIYAKKVPIPPYGNEMLSIWITKLLSSCLIGLSIFVSWFPNMNTWHIINMPWTSLLFTFTIHEW